jgi:shikimate kinase
MSIVLIGYRGSGKTTVGRLLGQKLGKPFVDADELIVARTGKTIAEIFANGGEQAFRDLESKVVAEIAGHADHVIALGGGALGREKNRDAIKAARHMIVYLRCVPEELLRRIEADRETAKTRPALTPLGGSVEEIRQLLASREPIWLEMTTHQLDVTRLSPEQATLELMKIL